MFKEADSSSSFSLSNLSWRVFELSVNFSADAMKEAAVFHLPRGLLVS